MLWSFYSDDAAVVTYKNIHYLWSKLQIITIESHVREMVHTMQQFKGIFTYFLHSSSSVPLLYTIYMTFLYEAEFESSLYTQSKIWIIILKSQILLKTNILIACSGVIINCKIRTQRYWRAGTWASSYSDNINGRVINAFNQYAVHHFLSLLLLLRLRNSLGSTKKHIKCWLEIPTYQEALLNNFFAIFGSCEFCRKLSNKFFCPAGYL